MQDQDGDLFAIHEYAEGIKRDPVYQEIGKQDTEPGRQSHPGKTLQWIPL